MAQLLVDRGFKVACLEFLSFAEQVSLMAQAEAIVAPHGAGLTNAAFCQPGVPLLELFAPEYVPSYFWEVAHWVGLPHYHLVCEPLPRPPHARPLDPGTADLLVDCDRLAAALDALGWTR